jgi:hypothetical protein
LLLVTVAAARAAGDGNRLNYLDDFCNPYYVGLDAPKLVTPQWIGEPGVEAIVVLAIDDMRDPQPYEKYLRPILKRLAKIDGRSPVSIMTTHVDPNHPQIEKWFKEGVTVEAHTYDHPCPCLRGGDFAQAKGTYDRSIDLLSTIPSGGPVAFRMPCCDSMNSVGPRFFAEMFNKTTPEGNFVRIDSSVFMLFTPDDPALPRDLVIEEDGRERFDKYVPRDRNFVNYIEDYPYPYVIDKLCWEMPSPVPDDWQGHNRHGPHSPTTVRDMKAAIDATVLKQGAFTLTFHPGGWIRNDQVIKLVDHAVTGRSGKVMFLNFREVHDRLTKHLLAGHPLRTTAGQDNGVRLLDVNRDGYMDVVIGNEKVRQTRVWHPEDGRWTTADFPVPIVSVDAKGNRRDAGVRFGVLEENGFAAVLVRNEEVSGMWRFDGRRWIEDPHGLDGLDLDGPVFTALDGRDRGVRLRDLDGDGRCELIVGNPGQQGVFGWLPKGGGWKRLPFTLPAGATIVDAQGRDAGLRFVDVDADGRDDVVFSNSKRYSVSGYTSMTDGWSRALLAGRRGDEKEIPPIVRADGTNNGAWFQYNRMWVQNEDTGGKLPHQIDSRHFNDLLGTDRQPPPRSPGAAQKAFATIGPALVQGNYHQYPPFYGSVIAPHAVAASGKVYCAFQNTKGQPVVMAYDVEKKQWSEPAYASRFGLGKDAHGNPSICIDREGTIHIFYGCHGGPMRYARSARPYAIDAWEEQPAPTSRATYPQSMLMADGSIYLFYRAGGHMEPWTFRQTGDGGRTWSGPEKIIEMRLAPPDRLAAAYCAFHPGARGKTVHCFWVHKDDNAARVKGDKKHPWRPLKYKGLHEAVYRYNMYYLHRDENGRWQNIDGAPAELPVSKAFADEHCLVFDSGDEFTGIGTPMVDGRNRPYVRFRYGVGDWKQGGRTIVPWRNLFAHHASGKWHVQETMPADWPEEVKAQAAAGGWAAYGDRSRGAWFISYQTDRFNPTAATQIFLEHESSGHAPRQGGPARLP